jgi:hypothetical protein
MSDKRATDRRRVFKGAKIVFNQGNSVVDCTVRNVSATGALVNVVNAMAVPQDFELRWDNKVRFCSVAWRKMDSLGIKFDE